MSIVHDDRLAALKQRYDEPQRHYHSWAHIEALLRHYETIEPSLYDPSAVLVALYWHDAIYDPKAADNEVQSAELMLKEAADLLALERINFAATIIRATATHTVPSGLSVQDQHDLELFLDIDLSILAAPDAVFDQYEEDIRKEYAHVPLNLYRQGRGAVLTRFLERDRLYFSDVFFSKWEQTARKNLQKSIKRLSELET